MNAKLILGFFIVIVLIMVLGFAATTKLDQLSQLTEKFYNHPFKVTTATKNIELGIGVMHGNMQDLLLEANENKREVFISKINSTERKVLKEYKLVFNNYLGDREDIQKSYDTFEEWKVLREGLIGFIKSNDLEKAKEMTQRERKYIENLIEEVDILVTYAQNKAKIFLKNSQKNKEDSLVFIYTLLSIIILFITFMFVILMRVIAKKTLDLENINEINKKDSWVKEGVLLLNNELGGDNNLSKVSLKSLNVLCNYINAGVGSLYIFDKKSQTLHYEVGFAYVQRNDFQDTFKLGEGIIGQVGLQKTPINLEEVGAGKLSIESGNTTTQALYTYTFPILYNNKLLAVIEIGSNKAFNEKVCSFLKLTPSLIAIGLVTARQNQDVKNLLEHSEKINAEMAQRQLALDSHSIVGITDIHGTITYANEKFSEVSGYSNAELVGGNHRLVNSGTYDDGFWNEMYETISSGKTWRHPAIKNKRKDGSTYWVDTTIFPFMGSDGKPESYIAICTDVTKNKEAEIELSKAKEDAEQAVVAKADFLASMSHEIRTPMNGVIGMLDLLSREKLTKEQSNNVGIASSSATSLLSVINDILDFFKIEAGKIELENIEYDIRQELGNFAKSIAITVSNVEVELLLDLGGLKHSYIYGDIGRLKQVLNNLVGNAIKFTHSGNIIIKAELEKYNLDEGNLKISIIDSGIGIAEDKLSTLFDAFTQADTSTTRKYGGTGLGLSIAKNLVGIMGGTLSVESTVDKGSIFSFSFGVMLSKNQPLLMPKTDIKGKKVLIVDDNEVNIQILCGQLKFWDMEVTSASSAKEAIAICKKQDKDNFFDIAILDMQMPEVDGETLGEELSTMPQCVDMKMIMMTSFGRHSNIKALRKKGFHGFFMKPTTASDLYDSLMLLVHDEYDTQTVLTENKIKSFIKNELKNTKDIKILLVEDNLTNQAVAQGMLSALDLKADIANHGEEAIEILTKNDVNYNIILMDCQMPILDGFETTALIRNGKCGKEYTKIPIIAMTANAMQGDKERCLVAGMDDYISKPISLEVLKETLMRWIEVTSNNVLVENELESWDEKELLERLGGSEQILLRIMEIFLTDITEQMRKLKIAIDTDNINELGLHAHTLKGSAGNLSAMKLQDLAKSIEHGVNTKGKEELSKEYVFLEEEVNTVVKIFNAYLDKVNIPKKNEKVISIEVLVDSLKSLKTELKSGAFIDTNAQEVFHSYYNDSINKQLKKLRSRIDSYMNDEAFGIINKIFIELGE